MSFLQVLTTIFEISMVLGLFWCFFHEDRLISFERKLMSNIRRRRLRVIKSTYSRVNAVKQ